jgi:hypothetical protein
MQTHAKEYRKMRFEGGDEKDLEAQVAHAAMGAAIVIAIVLIGLLVVGSALSRPLPPENHLPPENSVLIEEPAK